MFGILLTPLVALTLLTGGNSFQFSISKVLDNLQEVEKEEWSFVNVDESSENNAAVKVEIPKALGSEFPDINIFFANDKKEILQTSLKGKNIQGSFFTLPYRMQKSMEGSQIKKHSTSDYLTLEADILKTWLPEKWNKISASVHRTDGKIYNYYGIGNSKISIPDLMVLEEYKDYKPDNSLKQ